MKWLKQIFCKHEYLMTSYSDNAMYFNCVKCSKSKEVLDYKKKFNFN